MSDASVMARRVVVRDPKVARVLTDAHELGFLRLFVRRERSVTAVARALELDANHVLHRVRRLESLGVLRVSRLERRAGRPIKHYRAVAEEFFVPHAVVDGRSVESVFSEMDEPAQRLFRREYLSALAGGRGESEWGWSFSVDEQERYHLYLTEPDGSRVVSDALDATAVFNGSVMMWLDFEDAKALQREMSALMDRYLNRRGAQLYFMRLGLAPVSGVAGRAGRDEPGD